MAATLLVLLLLAAVCLGSRLGKTIYTNLNGTIVCTRLLDEYGAVGCTGLLMLSLFELPIIIKINPNKLRAHNGIAES